MYINTSFDQRSSNNERYINANSNQLLTGQLGIGPALCSKSRTDLKLKGSRLRLGHLPVSNDDQHSPAGFESRLEPDLPSLNPHYNRSSGRWPFKSCLVGGSDKARRKGIRYLSQQYGVCVLATKPSCRTWGLCPYNQPKQETWKLTNHSCGPSRDNQTNHNLFSFFIQKALLRANLRKPGSQSHSLCNQHSQHLVHERLTARTSANTSRPLRDTPVNQSTAQSGYRSSSLYNQCVHIIDRLQQHLQPDHTATSNICTNHRDYPRVLDAPSPHTNRRLSLRLSTTQTFNIQQRLLWRDTTTTTSTHIHLLCKISSVNQPQLTTPLNTYSRDRRTHTHILVPWQTQPS